MKQADYQFFKEKWLRLTRSDSERSRGGAFCQRL